MERLIVSGGLVATARGCFQADVLCENGRILEVGQGLEPGGTRLLDASGCLVMPGGVDVHTHFSLDLGYARVADGFEAASRAAAMGGTTCVVEHPGFGPVGCGLSQPVERAREEARGRSCIDYAVHAVVQSAAPEVLSGLAELVRSGHPSLKAYTTYAGRLDEPGLLALLSAAAASPEPVLTAVHCEDHAVVSHLAEALRRTAPRDPMSHPRSRPDYAEALAVRQITALALAAGEGVRLAAAGRGPSDADTALAGAGRGDRSCRVVHLDSGDALPRGQAGPSGHSQTPGETWPHARSRRAAPGKRDQAGQGSGQSAAAQAPPLYVVHLSSALGLEAVRQAQSAGQPVLAETCPQYLLLDQSLYAGPDGLAWVMAPPLRSEGDRQALWGGLADGSVSVVATDHCAFSLADKLRLGREGVFSCPGGAPGVETRLPLLYCFGVLAGRLSLERFVEVCCTAPARIMGLAAKGRLEPGLDADICVLDPSLERVLSPDTLHDGLDYTPFQGLAVRGWPRHVLIRGRLAVEDGRFVGSPDWGRFVPRRIRPHDIHPPKPSDTGS